jgi:hypothetical protein
MPLEQLRDQGRDRVLAKIRGKISETDFFKLRILGDCRE